MPKPAVLAIILFAAATFAGCAEDAQQPSNFRARQDAALRDPFNYGAYEEPDISGGGLTDFNRNAFKKDLNSVLNP